jgi:hypothetical protein
MNTTNSWRCAKLPSQIWIRSDLRRLAPIKDPRRVKRQNPRERSSWRTPSGKKQQGSNRSSATGRYRTPSSRGSAPRRRLSAASQRGGHQVLHPLHLQTRRQLNSPAEIGVNTTPASRNIFRGGCLTATRGKISVRSRINTARETFVSSGRTLRASYRVAAIRAARRLSQRLSRRRIIT